MGIGNQFKTVVLLALLTAILLWIGSFWQTTGLVVAAVFVLALNFISYFFSDKIVLFMYKAKEIQEKDNKVLFQIVREVADSAKIPMPKVYIVPSEQLNAFATGRSPKHSAVACTNGILKALNKDELKGVLAHEISHIKNRDTLIQVIAATIAGIIGFIASTARWAAIFGGIGGEDNNWVELLILAIVAPIAAVLLQLAISRSREYMADESAAMTLKNSKGLASALEKISKSVESTPLGMGNATTSSLFIANPFSGSAIMNLFSTHPPIDKRIARLKSMKF